jgi:SAM-dependent methyltransferase
VPFPSRIHHSGPEFSRGPPWTALPADRLAGMEMDVNPEQAVGRDYWSAVAEEWIAWARTPGHDAFWAYRDALARFIGQGGGMALDIGCGEGRVSRELKMLGYQVTACDAVAGMVAAAARVDSADGYAVADAAALPFDSGRFDLVMAYNMLMDVEDVPAVLAEIRRVLRPAGRLLISLAHPFRNRGRFVDAAPDAPFVLEGSYYGRQRCWAEERQNGVRVRFTGWWSQPLEAYVEALAGAGLAITGLREPLPEPRDGQDRTRQWMRVPLFLWLEARPMA